MVRGTRRKGPGCVVWELTLTCNFNCIHCGSSAGRARDDELTTREALTLCDDLKGIGTMGVALMGGEPLMRPDWPIVAQRVHDLGMELSIITNGWLAKTPEVTQHLQNLQPECVTVSLDGASPKTHDMIRGVPGSFERAIAAVDHFVNLGLPTTVITTVHKMNLKELSAIRDLLVDKGTAWQIQTATPHGRLEMKHVLSREEYYSVVLFIAASRKRYSNDRLKVAGAHDMGYFSRYLENPQVTPWRGCQAGISTLGIQSNGNILGCLALPDEFIEGNVREKPLCDIWYDESLFSYARHVKQSDLGQLCSTCEHRRFCKGGCSTMSNSLSGGLHRNSYCAYAIETEFDL